MIRPGLKCELCNTEKESIFSTDIYSCNISGCVVLHRVCHACVLNLVHNALSVANHEGETKNAS